MANTRIGRTVSVAGSRRKATFSAWVKRTGLGESWIAKFGGDYSQGQMMQIGFDSSDSCFIVGDIPTASATRLQSTRKFRDTNAWYHYVVAFDTEQATASNRLKFYINGEQVTSFGTETYPTQNLDLAFNRTGTYNNAWLGGRGESTYEFNGLMSHVHWCDGYAYAPSDFGETDSTTGEWKIKTSPSVSYGTNGYFMLKDGNSLTDASGNGNNFSSLVGTLTKTEDNPSNVFATLNPLVYIGTTTTYSQGNNTVSTSNANYKVSPSTLAVSTGKWYMEFKAVSGGFGTIDACVGILPTDTDFSTGSNNLNAYSNGSSYGSHGQVKQSGSGTLYTGSTYADGDIIGIALDMDNHKLYFRKNNNAWENSGNPTSGSTGTGAVSITSGIEYYFACASIASGGTKVFSANFGNGSFGSTQLTGTTYQANGLGIFQYQPPTGYTALCTKGLNL